MSRLTQELESGRYPAEKDLAELEVFLSLQRVGMKPAEAINLAFEKPDGLIKKLRQGKSLEESLHAGSQWDLFRTLTAHMGLEQAVILVRQLKETEQALSLKPLASLVYPACLLAGTTGILVFFQASIVPVMADFLEGDNLVILLAGFKWLLLLVCLTGLVCAAVLAAGFAGKSIRTGKIGLVKSLQTVLFLDLFSTLEKTGLSTRDLVDVMEKAAGTSCQKVLVHSFRQQLEAGNSLVQALEHCSLLDQSVLPYVRSGIENGRLEQMLDIWNSRTRRQMDRQVKKAVQMASAAAYGSVGILAVLVYQILLAPMNLLYTI